MHYEPILGTLGYVLSPDQKKVLMVHRTKKNGDPHLGKYNGLGGKMHDDEDIVTCMKREIKEEANIECEELILRGSINWTNFGPKGENWLGFIFLITSFNGEVNYDSPEGPLEWVEKDSILSLPLWESDKYFLPLVFDEHPKAFHGVMPYDNDKVLDWRYTRI